MQPQQSQQMPPSESLGLLFQWVYLLSLSHITCLTVFIRSRFGTHAFGLNGAIAFLMIPVYGAFAQAPEMLAFFPFWLGALVIQRARSFRLARRGVVQHSRYAGWPYLAMCVPFVRREKTAKILIEPIFCLLAGSFLMPVSQALGGFILLGVLTFMVTAGTDMEINRARVRAMRDAQILHQQLSERLRGLRDEF